MPRTIVTVATLDTVTAYEVADLETGTATETSTSLSIQVPKYSAPAQNHHYDS